MGSEVVTDEVSATSVEQVGAVLRDATEHGRTVLPVGRRTTVDWLAGPPTDVVLSLREMDAVLEHSAGDLVVHVHVHAGARLRDVQAALAEAGQRLAVTAPVDDVTIGGLINADLSGPERYRYGTVRDLIIGTTSVRGDGVVTRSGGKVVKNVAGYDLGKLYTGSRGTLGVITDAWFRLHPIPEATRWITVDAADPTGVGRVFAAVRDSQSAPTAIEVRRDGELTVVVQIDGVGAGIDARAAQLCVLTGGTATDTEPVGWTRWPDEEVLLTVTHDPAAVTSVLEALGDVGVVGSAVGVLRVGRAAEVLARARTVARRHHGTAVVLRAPAGCGLDVWGPMDPALLRLMRRVKAEFDPGATLSPGRAVDGI